MALRRDEHYDEWETISPEARNNFLNGKLRLQMRHVYDHSSAARKVFEKAGLEADDVKNVSDLARLPVTRKEDIIRLQEENPPYGGLETVALSEIERVFISPGPVYEVQPAHVEWFSRALWAAGFRRGDVVLNSFTYHLSPAGLLMHEGLRNCGATVVVTGAGNTEIQLRAMKHLKVTGFLGTPSFLMTLIKRAEEAGEDFREKYELQRAWFTGEPLAASARTAFEQEYGIDTFQGYAVTEPGGVIAYECQCKQGFHLMDDYVVEIVDPATGSPVEAGEVGEVLVTPIHNKTWGLVRFGTGDLSTLDTSPCPCGRSAPRLKGILGRAGDAVKIRGMFVVGREVDGLMGRFKEVTNYKLRVSRSGERDLAEMIISLKTGADELAVSSQIARDFQSRCRIKLDDIRIEAEGSFKPGDAKIEDSRTWE
ncbi:MAG: AMP-binding protein [Dehalococcoidales bacterium]|jgi:phenylacetate-CoA ligase|nr:AMP-binding protein [Dehalococcoidales bacterium]MDD3264381.1 AMP-binding protein [Dehalococcoidales bacterium]MDD4322168.1 AMP-binding protein [Dehalococcoidales bacterium]MDD4793739.1 AMP-binding protein [Dehalococcoidales bacterium]MDD5121800.1 AMP-binding protein [Dehalococcoidales bacterium]